MRQSPQNALSMTCSSIKESNDDSASDEGLARGDDERAAARRHREGEMTMNTGCSATIDDWGQTGKCGESHARNYAARWSLSRTKSC